MDPNSRCSSQPLKGLLDAEWVGVNSPSTGASSTKDSLLDWNWVHCRAWHYPVQSLVRLLMRAS